MVVWRVFCLFLVFSATQSEAFSYRYPITGWNFDWDDNIFYMPTEIRLWTRSGEEIGVSTGQYALIREKIGKEEPWLHHEVRTDLATGSLRFFGDEASNENVFLADVLKAIGAGNDEWKGPSWNAFVRAMSNSQTAAHTSIITARLHSPKTIYAALKELQQRGYIRYLPLLRNIFPVSYPKIDPRFSGSASSPSAAKTAVMGFLLDEMNALPSKGRPLVENREGTGQSQLHLWGFSDDDHGNYLAAAAFLQQGVRDGRWPQVKINLYFTGKNHPTEKAKMEVIQSDGTLRLVALPKGACPEALR
jgi:hypothetical protein